MTSLPQAPHVKKVFLDGETGLLLGARQTSKPILFLELSTIDVQISDEIASQVDAAGVGNFVDAPCSVSDDTYVSPPTLTTDLLTRRTIGRRNGR